MIWGISLLAAVVAGGFFWLGKTALRKKIGNGMPNYWAAFLLYLLGGTATAVTLLPLLRWVGGWTWLVVLASFAFLALTLATVQDIGADKKPDKMALLAAKAAPALGLLAVWHWSEFTGSVHTQVASFMTSLGG